MKTAFLIVTLAIIIAAVVVTIAVKSLTDKNEKIQISKLDNMITGTWQAEVKFPDWKGYVDDTLAMNSMYSFDGVKNQGK